MIVIYNDYMGICQKYIKLVKKCRKLGYTGKSKPMPQMELIYKELMSKSNSSEFLPRKRFLKKVSKGLNENLPKSEVWFNSKYKNSGINIKFEANKPFGGYIPDLINKDLKLIIEIDGSIHQNEDVKKKDDKKDLKYKQLGFRVIRLIAYNEESYNEAINQLRAIKTKIPIKKEPIKKSHNPIYVGIIIRKETKCDICTKNLSYSYNSKSGGDYCNICFDLILSKSLE